MYLSLPPGPTLERGPAGVGMGEGVVGVAGQHAGEVRGILDLLVLQPQGLGQLVGRTGVVGVERQGLPGGLLPVPEPILQMPR